MAGLTFLAPRRAIFFDRAIQWYFWILASSCCHFFRRRYSMLPFFFAMDSPDQYLSQKVGRQNIPRISGRGFGVR